ncbi:MAG: hypothetical protein E7342_00680 [Clostridiales bacterium]|nr:hypothetical protein [Clostridiales bacterium]
MKTLSKLLVVLLAIATCLSVFVGCGKLTKEDIAYNMICYVAEDNQQDIANITLMSGTLKEDENGNYEAWFKVKVGYFTFYYMGTYYVDTEKIDYTDVSHLVNLTPTGAGPLYLATDSFNIDKVNNKLINSK